MEYMQVTIYTNTEGLEPLTARFADHGITGCAIEDASDFEEFLKDVTPRWDYVDEDLLKKMRGAETNVKVFLPKNAQGFEQLNIVRGVADEFKKTGLYGRMDVELDAVRDEDWANAWKQYFHPIKVGRKFLIKPSWEDAGETDRIVLEMDPGNAFGSGTHETTRLCIVLCEDVLKPGIRVLDMGCGSGILACAACLGGAGEAVMVDVDEAAVKTAGENLERNGLSCYKAYCGNVLADAALDEKLGGEYDLIFGNIVADVLMDMAELFYRKLKADGALIVSGIIGTRADEVRAALEKAGFRVERTEKDNDWTAFRMKKS